MDKYFKMIIIWFLKKEYDIIEIFDIILKTDHIMIYIFKVYSLTIKDFIYN